MQGPDPNWDGKQKPDCAESYVPVIIDALTASTTASFAVRMATGEDPAIPQDVALGVTGVLVALLYTASATSGARKYNACRAATASWRVREAIRERDEAAPGHEANALVSAVPAGADAPRAALAIQAYYCVHSPSRPYLEICGRNRGWCDHARRVMGVVDSVPCVPSNAVWCFSASDAKRCFATTSACEFHRGKVSSAARECSEQR
jgi:hypothetical protein